jgi:hypothetical protein
MKSDEIATVKTMPELLDSILGLVIFFSPLITAFGLVTFSPVRELHQPLRLLVVGLANGTIAAFLSAPGMLRGMITSRALLFIVGASMGIGAFFSLLTSSESISQKKRDERVRTIEDKNDIATKF